VLGEGAVVRLWDVRAGREVARLTVPGKNRMRAMEPVDFTRDGTRLLTQYDSGDHENVHDGWTVWDVAKRTPVAEVIFPGPEMASHSRFTPDERHVLTTGGGMRLWEVATGKRVRYWPLGEGGIGISPSGRVVATSGFLSVVTLWDAWTFDKLTTFGLMLSGGGGSVPAFSRDGRRIAVGDVDVIRVWELTEK
jgi:WD40 repeat protein